MSLSCKDMTDTAKRDAQNYSNKHIAHQEKNQRLEEKHNEPEPPE